MKVPLKNRNLKQRLNDHRQKQIVCSNTKSQFNGRLGGGGARRGHDIFLKKRFCFVLSLFD